MPVIIPERALKIDYNYAQVPSLSDPRVIERGRAPTEHKHLKPKYYKYVFYFFMATVFGPFFTVPLAALAVSGLVNYFYPLPWYVILLVVALSMYRSYSKIMTFFTNILKLRLIGHEFHEYPSIKELPNYKNSELMWLLWVISPYRRTLLRVALSQGLISQADFDANMAKREEALTALQAMEAAEDEKGVDMYHLFPPIGPSSQSPSAPPSPTPVSPRGFPDACYPKDSPYILTDIPVKLELPAPVDTWDRPEESTFFQPSEGFCGPATLNTVNYSLYGADLLPTTRFPVPLSIHEVVDIYSHNNPNITGHHDCKPKCVLPSSVLHKVLAVTPYYCNDTLTYSQFLVLLQHSNNVNKRVLCNFLRAPLFNPRPGHVGQRSVALMGGHWSPIASFEPHSHHVMVLDVNNNYGSFIVHAYLLYKACFTKDGSKFRGLIILDVHDEEVVHKIGATRA